MRASFRSSHGQVYKVDKVCGKLEFDDDCLGSRQYLGVSYKAGTRGGVSSRLEKGQVRWTDARDNMLNLGG